MNVGGHDNVTFMHPLVFPPKVPQINFFIFVCHSIAKKMRIFLESWEEGKKMCCCWHVAMYS